MDEKTINEAMDNRFDGVECCVIVEELLGLEADNKRLRKELVKEYNRGLKDGLKQGEKIIKSITRVLKEIKP